MMEYIHSIVSENFMRLSFLDFLTTRDVLLLIGVLSLTFTVFLKNCAAFTVQGILFISIWIQYWLQKKTFLIGTENSAIEQINITFYLVLWVIQVFVFAAISIDSIKKIKYKEEEVK